MSGMKRQAQANAVRPSQPAQHPRRDLVPIDVIISGLAAQALPLCQHLFANGVREGHEFRVGSLAGEPGRSMAVHLSADRAGVWSDFSTGETGDALDLVAQARFAGDKGQALKWARGWLGLDGTNPDALKQTHRAIAAKRDEPDQRTDTRKAAFRLWLEAQEKVKGTPVDLYLQGRRINLDILGLQPRALRYHPALWNRETDAQHPAMVAAIVGADGATIACHRTWLEPDPDRPGGWRKLSVDDSKMVLGSFRGGSIRLWRGSSRKALASAPAGETVIVTEGIEDALTVALATPQYRVIAAVSLANMGSVILPSQIGQVIICADNDWGNEQAAKGLNRAIEHFAGAGHQVRLARSPVGKDMNDLLRADGGGDGS